MKKMVICTGMLLCMGEQAMAAASGYTMPSQVKRIINGSVYKYNPFYGTLYKSSKKGRVSKKEQRRSERFQSTRRGSSAGGGKGKKKGIDLSIIRKWISGKSMFQKFEKWIPAPKAAIHYSVGYNYKGIPLFRIGPDHYIFKKVLGKVKRELIDLSDVNKHHAMYSIRGLGVKVSLNIAARSYFGYGVRDYMPIRAKNPKNFLLQKGPTHGILNLGFLHNVYLKSGVGFPGVAAKNFSFESHNHVEGHMAQILYLLQNAPPSNRLGSAKYDLKINNKDGPCTPCRNKGDIKGVKEGQGQVGKILPATLKLVVWYKPTLKSNWTDYTIDGNRS